MSNIFDQMVSAMGAVWLVQAVKSGSRQKVEQAMRTHRILLSDREEAIRLLKQQARQHENMLRQKFGNTRDDLIAHANENFARVLEELSQ